jgi:hypothetical protein
MKAHEAREAYKEARKDSQTKGKHYKKAKRKIEKSAKQGYTGLIQIFNIQRWEASDLKRRLEAEGYEVEVEELSGRSYKFNIDWYEGATN